MSENESQQSIEVLQKRHQAFQAEKVRYETQRDTALEELELLKKQARELYDSDDVAQLEAMLAKMKSENEQKRSEYQASLDEIDKNLKAVKDEFAAAAEDE